MRVTQFKLLFGSYLLFLSLPVKVLCLVVPCVLSVLPTISLITLFIVCVFVSVVEFPNVGAMSCFVVCVAFLGQINFFRVLKVHFIFILLYDTLT